MGSVRADVSGAVKTRTALVVSARYISNGVSDFFALFMTEKSGHMIKCLLTEWEGRTGKYLARGYAVRTERSEVRTNDQEPNIFPSGPTQLSQ